MKDSINKTLNFAGQAFVASDRLGCCHLEATFAAEEIAQDLNCIFEYRQQADVFIFRSKDAN